MSIYSCPSTLELVAYQTGEDPDGRTEQHLAECPRCRALLTNMPAVHEPQAGRERAMPRVAPRVLPEAPGDLRTGQLWAAQVEGDADWREVVTVLARQPSVGGHELVLVAPVNTQLEDAASSDVIVDDSPLGYRHLVSVGLQGVVLCDQLERYLGRLDRPIREALAAAYQSVLSGSAPETLIPTGAPLAGPDDSRTWTRAIRADQLRPLFAAAGRLLGNEEDAADTLGAILTLTVSGNDWDRQTLLSAASIEGAVFDRILHDDLDLTDQADVADIGRVVNVIQLDDWRDPVRRSLRRSRGGMRRASGDTEQAIAARSFAGVSETQRERDLMRGQSIVDDSPTARDQAIENYIRSLEKELDDA